MTLEMGDDPVHSAGKKAETSADAANEEGIEAIKTGEDFFGEFAAAVGLFAEENGMNILTVEEDDPVAGQFGVEDGDEIDGAGSDRRFALCPNPDGIQAFGQIEIALTLGHKMVHVLEGGDELSLPDFLCQILNGVAYGQHGFVVEKVGYVGSRKLLFSVLT